MICGVFLFVLYTHLGCFGAVESVQIRNTFAVTATDALRNFSADANPERRSRYLEIVEASELLKELWGDDNYFNLRSLNVYITRLSNHLKADPTVEIESIRGVGYLLK